MPTNKEAYIRYTIIDECLVNKKKPYPSMEDFIHTCKDKLGKDFAISTIQKDIQAMKTDELLKFSAPIKFSKSRNGYYYSDPNYSIKAFPLNNGELAILTDTLDFLSVIGDKNISDEFRAVQVKLENLIHYPKTRNKSKIPSAIKQCPPKHMALENYKPLMEHIKRKSVIEIMYYSMRYGEIIEETLHPYQLLEFDHRWYVLGYSRTSKKVSVYGLDRIIPGFMINKRDKFIESKRAEVLKYNNDMYGVYPLEGEKKQKIQFWVAKHFDWIMETNPLHLSQVQVDRSHEWLTLYTINVFPTHELVRWFLGHLNETRVVTPSLKQKIIEAIGKKK